MPPTTHCRTIFISDTHLGSRTCNADVLLDFLRRHTCDKLVIVGDFIDFWAMRRRLHFPAAHHEVLRTVIGWSARGVAIEYIPGNHDDVIRPYLPMVTDRLRISEESVHVTADGRRFLVTHGDAYDQVMRYARWLALLGDAAYHMLTRSNALVNRVRRHAGRGPWSLSAWVKHRVKSAVNIISDYEEAVARDVLNRGFDGVICGHIHCPELRDMHGIVYANCGDFVESCTALVEDASGALRLVEWHAGAARLPRREVVAPGAAVVAINRPDAGSPPGGPEPGVLSDLAVLRPATSGRSFR